MATFSLDDALLCARLNLNLKKEHVTEEQYELYGLGLELIHTDRHEDTDTEYSITGSLNNIYITFKGTDSLTDAFLDLDVRLKRYRYHQTRVNWTWLFWWMNSRVHAGFLKAYASVRDDIMTILRTFPNSNLFISGMSLGGSLAYLCALDLCANTEWKPTVYTFGSPKVGNKKFVKSYAEKVWDSYRITLEEDPIPVILPYPYMHPDLAPCTHIAINGDGSLHDVKNSIESGKTFKFRKEHLFGLLKNHSVEAYISALLTVRSYKNERARGNTTKRITR